MPYKNTDRVECEIHTKFGFVIRSHFLHIAMTYHGNNHRIQKKIRHFESLRYNIYNLWNTVRVQGYTIRIERMNLQIEIQRPRYLHTAQISQE